MKATDLDEKRLKNVEKIVRGTKSDAFHEKKTGCLTVKQKIDENLEKHTKNSDICLTTEYNELIIRI